MAYQGTPPYQGGPPPYQGPQGPQYSGVPASQYSDWIHRVGAYLVDFVPYGVLIFIGAITGHTSIFLLFVILGLGSIAYNRWFLGGQGQSLRKRTLGMRLISEQTGQPIGTLNAF